MGFYEKYLCLCNSINKSPSAVALELKIGKPSVTRWKNGATPRDATVLKIADYFGVTVTELMSGVEEQKEAPGISAEGLDGETKKIVDFIRSASTEELMEVCRYIAYLESKRESHDD